MTRDIILGMSELNTNTLQIDNSSKPWMVRTVMQVSGGVIKDDRSAAYVLAGGVVLLCALAIFLLTHMGAKIEPKNVFDPSKPSDDSPQYHGYAK